MCVRADLHLFFLYVNLIWFIRFLFRSIWFSFVFLYIFYFQNILLSVFDLDVLCLFWSTRMFSFFNRPNALIFILNFRHSWMGRTNIFFLHSTVDCYLQLVLQTFSLFQLTILLLESCFLSIKHAQSLVEVYKKCFLIVNRFCWSLF